MKRDSRLSGVLHVLLHMAEQDGPATSETLARAMQTNPVVVRRILSGLRDRGYVHSEKGHGGGWTLAPGWEAITLRQVHEALDAPPLFAIGHRAASPDCLVEKAVNAALGSALAEAEAALLARFSTVTLGALSAGFHEGMTRRARSKTEECLHDR